MAVLWLPLILLALQLTPVPAIRVYTGTALSTYPEHMSIQEQDGEDSKLIKRSWSPPSAQPGLYKVKLTQRGYIQFLRYLADIPPLQQYTFCIWVVSTNYTHNHPLFSYSRNEKESLVKVWLSPSDGTLMTTFKDQAILRVPVNIREGRWYHICQSWSGVTGEIVLFVDGKVRAHEKIQRHIGTMLPGGGDIAVGQELTDFDKGLDDGVEGEIFGFNLVDEAIDPHDSTTQTLPHYRPEIDSKSFVPQFKKLPTIRKTFEDINSYISNLPTDAETATSAPQESISNIDQSQVHPSRRVKPRVRSKPPVRKVVIYREDRMDDGHPAYRGDRSEDPNNRGQRVLNRVGPPKPEDTNSIPDAPRTKISQVYDVTYNMHTYRGPKDRPKAPGYKIYEDVGDEERLEESEVPEPITGDSTSSGTTNRRRARQNFDVYSLWEANRMNPFYVRPLEPHRSKYHFEKEQQASRRSFTVEPLEEAADQPRKTVIRTRQTLPDVIPVHEEVEEGLRRRRRDVETDPKRDARHIQSGATDFRRLPTLPDGFVNLLNSAANKEAILAKLSLYLGSNRTADAARLPPAVTFTGNEELQRRNPQHFPSLEDILLSQQESLVPEASQSILENRQSHELPPVRNLESAGSDLVSRTLSHCGAARGSPITNKRHLLISWADTPVRIYGGAMVTNANNICGHF